ncbi:unnamed protein product [Didymodactylos carnosus]|uniref:MIR domain-containing protein n=1 Tax=Didymodactylos carnosus TaxID=1234261 RepID=A0A815FZZ9_9BILA|nr:unnamed protein product [Didymodactylos carnosus]CAF1332110.1 unnamed protein product [Didymodactylos carnosus]CAF3825718.1 unnamed protein product [Didymodactylos carnosus]CAF4186582.1 unnamed protein product [Didymodactylos carnosus]
MSLQDGFSPMGSSDIHPVLYGTQITMRNAADTITKPCYLHSTATNYPPITKNDFRHDIIENGDLIRLVHQNTSGILVSGLNPCPISRTCREVACVKKDRFDCQKQHLNAKLCIVTIYGIDLWRDITNRQDVGNVLLPFQSHIRLTNLYSGKVLKMTKNRLPSWGNKQMEVVTDVRSLDVELESTWIVEEYKNPDRRIWEPMTVIMKYFELQWRMFNPPNGYSCRVHPSYSSPLWWPFGLAKPVPYWKNFVTGESTLLVPNLIVYFVATITILIYLIVWIFYITRRSYCIFDIDKATWIRISTGTYLIIGSYITNYIPWFFYSSSSVTFHSYLLAIVFKLMAFGYCLGHFYRYSTQYVTITL